MCTNGNYPLVSIQSDWDECLRGRNKEAWISYKYRGQSSVTGKLQLFDGKISCSEGFEVVLYNGKSVTIKHKESDTTTVFIAPMTTFHLHNKACTRVSVTSGGLGLSSGSQGELHVWEVQRGVIRRSLEGQVGELYQCRWFPSGVVVLAGGADWRARIWCAQTGRCPVTLAGHTGPITDLAIVDRGRNVITVSKDGTARLWDVGESQCLATLCKLPTSGTCCILTSSNQLELPPSGEPISEREVGTEDKVLVVGGEDGTLLLVAVRARAELARRILSSPVTAMTLISNETLAAGTEDGQIHLLNVVSQLSTVMTIHESNSPVRSLLGIKEKLLFAGLGDGVCIGYGMIPPFNGSLRFPRLQLTGSDFEPVYDLTWDGQSHIYTATRDGKVRKYNAGSLIEKLYG